jgi:5-methyltetrahydrofolate--homocysteine methyltransferase
MSVIEEIRQAVIEGQAKVAVAKVNQALDEGTAPDVILNDGLIAPMRRVGQLFEEGEYYVPEMLIAARAMSGALQILKPHLVAQGVKPISKVAIGTVKGDLHDIGKNLVAMMLEGSGLEIVDLGVDVPPEKFIEAIQNGAQIVALSALLTTTMPNMGVTIKAIEKAGLRDRVKIMVGGAPVTQAYADQIGADAFSLDASAATRTAFKLLNIAAEE